MGLSIPKIQLFQNIKEDLTLRRKIASMYLWHYSVTILDQLQDILCRTSLIFLTIMQMCFMITPTKSFKTALAFFIFHAAPIFIYIKYYTYKIQSMQSNYCRLAMIVTEKHNSEYGLSLQMKRMWPRWNSPMTLVRLPQKKPAIARPHTRNSLLDTSSIFHLAVIQLFHYLITKYWMN